MQERMEKERLSKLDHMGAARLVHRPNPNSALFTTEKEQLQSWCDCDVVLPMLLEVTGKEFSGELNGRNYIYV